MEKTLIGFLVKGPRELPKNRFQEAIDQVIKVLKIRDDCLDRENITNEILSKLRALSPDLCGFDVKEFFDSLTGFHANEIDAQTIVKDIFDSWLGSYSDYHWRYDPDNHKQVIMFCGASTSGEAPKGEAYQYMLRGYRLNIWHFFNVQ